MKNQDVLQKVFYDRRKNWDMPEKWHIACVCLFIAFKPFLNLFEKWQFKHILERYTWCSKACQHWYTVLSDTSGGGHLYNIGWHWGLYENIIMTSAVYSHTTRNKAIQYYYYYIIWSWLCSEILTILMYTVYVSSQALQLSSTLLTEVIRIRQACVGLPTPFLQIIVALTLGSTIVKHLYIAWLSLYLVISMNSR